jgi:hypothetical protein
MSGINTTSAAKAELSFDQLMSLLSLAGKYITATKNQMTNATSQYNRLKRQCKHYDMNMTYLLKEATDYFSRRPNSKYL